MKTFSTLRRQARQSVPIAIVAVSLLAAVYDPAWADAASELAPGDGRDLVIDNCTVCHSARIILQNHMTRQRWDETITWMQKKQGLWVLQKEVREKILDYLAKTQGPEEPTAPRKRANKMYRFDYSPNPL
ncbi:MAG: hypothetical protein ACE5G9_05115 [Nitrospinales bacterium]